MGWIYKILATLLSLMLFSPLNSFEVGDFNIGGSLRTNYVLGDYNKTNTGAPQRGGEGGNFELETFTTKITYQKKQFTSKVEYRWYDGYNFFHTAQLEFKKDEQNFILGLNRVPFGVGAYGPANSWFFDQHFYLGLSDDMDLGIQANLKFKGLDLDLGYYPQSEWQGAGDSADSARYAYDIVNERTEFNLYEEKHQFNLRVRKKFEGEIVHEPGLSVQFGFLDGEAGLAEDSTAQAFSLHSVSTYKSWKLMLQATSYHYDAEYNGPNNTAAGLAFDDDLIGMGGYDFAWPVASKGEIYSVALSYKWLPEVDWIDSMTFYNDYSILVKSGDFGGVSFNDSALNVFGVAIANDGWYIYIDQAFSNGNYFVGNEGDDYAVRQVGDFGINGNNKWNGRFNINTGYYF